MTLILLATSIRFYWRSWNRLFFQEYKANLTPKQFKRVVKATAQELGWKRIKVNGNSVEAYRKAIEGFGGEKIIIKEIGNKILINSICNYKLPKRSYSSKRNKENVHSFLINVENLLKGKDVEKISAANKKKKEDAFWEESEWTIGEILIRIVGYGLALFFLLAGIWLLYEGIWYGVVPLVPIFRISFKYIKTDIQIIQEKYRKKKFKQRFV